MTIEERQDKIYFKYWQLIRGEPISKIGIEFNPNISVWFKLRVTLAMLRWSVYILWFSFMLALNFIFFCLKLIIIHHHIQIKTNEKAMKKLNHNIYLDLISYPDLLLLKPKARSCQIRFVHVIACQELVSFAAVIMARAKAVNSAR